MSRRTVLILEDNPERVATFTAVLRDSAIGLEPKIWPDAGSFIAEAERHFSDAALISLDHDLNPQPGALVDPGTGVEVAEFLADYLPVCPVLIHSSNADRAWSMFNELRFAHWSVQRVGPDQDLAWVRKFWLPEVRRLAAMESPPEHHWRPTHENDSSLAAAELSLRGTGLGDALGEICAYQAHRAPERLLHGPLPPPPWLHTDDTEMALAVFEVLRAHGHIEPDALARRFHRRFERDPDRGYGSGTRLQLRALAAGDSWHTTAAQAFSGAGSMGNGAAMRAAPVGAFFAGDFARVVREAEASAQVTHHHPEGRAGAIAVALAAAWAASPPESTGPTFWNDVLHWTPASEVYRGLEQAAALGPNTSPGEAARVLGNGSRVTAPDTVPYALWCAQTHLHDFRRALSAAIEVGGDCDTTAAIAGGIVALRAGESGLPREWLEARDPDWQHALNPWKCRWKPLRP